MDAARELRAYSAVTRFEGTPVIACCSHQRDWARTMASFVEQLAERVKKRQRERRQQDAAVVAFLAAKSDIAEAIAAGFSLKTIWEFLHEQGRIPYRYETFLKHVKRFITSQQRPSPPPRSATEPRLPQRTTAQQPAANRPSPAGISGFNFEPVPRKEELF